MTAKHGGGAAAAGSAGVYVLGLYVIYEHAAVHVHYAQLHAARAEKALEQIMSQHAKIPGYNRVIIEWVTSCFTEMCL